MRPSQTRRSYRSTNDVDERSAGHRGGRPAGNLRGGEVSSKADRLLGIDRLGGDEGKGSGGSGTTATARTEATAVSEDVPLLLFSRDSSPAGGSRGYEGIESNIRRRRSGGEQQHQRTQSQQPDWTRREMAERDLSRSPGRSRASRSPGRNSQRSSRSPGRGSCGASGDATSFESPGGGTADSQSRNWQASYNSYSEMGGDGHRGGTGSHKDGPIASPGAPWTGGGAASSLLEVPEEVLAVRRAALTVFSPLTYTWLVVSIGFSTTVALGMARWTNVLRSVPTWAILLPSWLSHVGLFVCHVLSARALSTFIAQANDNRQRHDSTDHLDRTEYLPLLQRSLKFGLKTGLLSFCIFLSEVLIYLRLVHQSMSLGLALTPIWIIVVFGVIDGIVCKTQHVLRLVCWLLLLSSMVMIVLKTDHGYDSIRWRVAVSPVVAMLSVSSATLIYIVYGHQVGYFRLTESQLTAGILYSMATLISILLVVTMGEIIPSVDPEEVEMRFFVVALAPLVMALVGLGAWVVSRDEFERYLRYGGQATVHPMKLRLETRGWTSVETKGVTCIPMFGEVSYAPLDSSRTDSLELCACCACYPYEDEDEVLLQSSPQHDNNRIGGGGNDPGGAAGRGGGGEMGDRPYLVSTVSSQQSGRSGGTGEALIHPRMVV